MLFLLKRGSRWLRMSACLCPAVQEAAQDPADGPERLISSWSDFMAAMVKGEPAQPQAAAPAAASGRGLSRTARVPRRWWPAGGSAGRQQPAPQMLSAPATPRGQARSPWSHRTSRYGPSQVVPAPLEDGQHPDGSKPLLAAQQGQHSPQQTPSLAKSIFSRVAVIGNRRLLAEQQQRRAAVSAAGQEEPKAAPVWATTRVVPFQPQSGGPERPGSPTEAPSRGMAAATGSEGGHGLGSATLTHRGST